MKKVFGIVFKLLLVIGCLIGIILSINTKANIFSMLSYYTIQSNIICFITFTIILILEFTHKLKKTDKYYLIKGAVTICIILTGVVYNIILRPQMFAMAGYNQSLSNFLVHTYTPLMVLLDYIIFDKKGMFKYKYALYWLIIPLFYTAFVYIRAALGGTFNALDTVSKYPYFFLDIDTLGLLNTVLWILGMGLAIYLVSILLIFIDRKIKK